MALVGAWLLPASVGTLAVILAAHGVAAAGEAAGGAEAEAGGVKVCVARWLHDREAAVSLRFPFRVLGDFSALPIALVLLTIARLLPPPARPETPGVQNIDVSAWLAMIGAWLYACAYARFPALENRIRLLRSRRVRPRISRAFLSRSPSDSLSLGQAAGCSNWGESVRKSSDLVNPRWGDIDLPRAPTRFTFFFCILPLPPTLPFPQRRYCERLQSGAPPMSPRRSREASDLDIVSRP